MSLGPATRTRIMFYSGSKHTYPGTGASEFLTEEDKASGRFDPLFALTGFRKRMSNFAEIEDGFLCRGKRWATVEHCFQGIKFEEDYPEHGATFALDSNSELSRGGGAAARRGGSKKTQPLTPARLKRWDARKWDVVEEALYAKYSQVDELKQILLATLDAELVHRPPRSHLVAEHGLMRVRERIRQEEEEAAASA